MFPSLYAIILGLKKGNRKIIKYFKAKRTFFSSLYNSLWFSSYISLFHTGDFSAKKKVYFLNQQSFVLFSFPFFFWNQSMIFALRIISTAESTCEEIKENKIQIS